MRKLVAIVLSCAIGAAALGVGYQAWKGMVYTQPAMDTLTRDQLLVGLKDFSSVSIIVEELPEPFKDTITDRDLQTWTENRLRNMGVEVISHEKRRSDYISKSSGRDKLSEAQLLRLEDQFRSVVLVKLGGLRHDQGTISYDLTLSCQRGVLIHPGHFYMAGIWDMSTIGYYGSAVEGKAVVRKVLNNLLDELETDWKTCNSK